MKQKNDGKHYSVWNNTIYLLRDIRKEYKLLLVLLITEGVTSVLIPLLGIYLPKLAVELVVEKATAQRVWLELGGFTLLLMGVMALRNMSLGAKYIQYNDLRHYYLHKLLFKSLDCDYGQIESASGQNRYQKAKQTLMGGDMSGTSVMVPSMLAILTGSLNFILFSGVIATFNPLLVLLLVGLSAVNYLALRHARSYEHASKEDMAGQERKLSYLASQSADVKGAKDIRLYGMNNWFGLMREQLLDSYVALIRSIKNRHFGAGAVNALTLLLRDGAAYVYLIWSFANGSVMLGEFVLYFAAVTGFSGWVNQIVDNINNINGANLKMNDLREFLEFSDASEPDYPAPSPAPCSPVSIEFRKVSFSYDSHSGKVLDNFSLSIRPGEKLALVGVNGAGKTTIVKLLCGFYKPDSGVILLNGINLERFRRKDLFAIFSAVFQDITILPFSVSDNVSMKVKADTDPALVWACLEKTGLDREIRKFEKGIDTKMLKAIDSNGIVLSGGQQQKLLMARALYKNAPVLILDEPTAALDPIAESETYEQFHMLSMGKTAIYISHRLASTRFCDRIAFIKDGVIMESGSHEELMQMNGEYAGMYYIQSHYYHQEAVSL